MRLHAETLEHLGKMYPPPFRDLKSLFRKKVMNLKLYSRPILPVALKKQAECHFCFEKIEEKELLTMKTPSCGQRAHCGCVRVWAAVSVNTIVRCAYCRATFPDEDLCFLCLQEKKNHEQFVTTNCCQTKVHQHCIEDPRRALLSTKGFFFFSVHTGMRSTYMVRLHLDEHLKTF